MSDSRKCQLCGKRLEPEIDCCEYENYDCLCWDCKNEQEELDDGILFI